MKDRKTIRLEGYDIQKTDVISLRFAHKAERDYSVKSSAVRCVLNEAGGWWKEPGMNCRNSMAVS